jgi:hypothetical protein
LEALKMTTALPTRRWLSELHEAFVAEDHEGIQELLLEIATQAPHLKDEVVRVDDEHIDGAVEFVERIFYLPSTRVKVEPEAKVQPKPEPSTQQSIVPSAEPELVAPAALSPPSPSIVPEALPQALAQPASVGASIRDRLNQIGKEKAEKEAAAKFKAEVPISSPEASPEAPAKRHPALSDFADGEELKAIVKLPAREREEEFKRRQREDAWSRGSVILDPTRPMEIARTFVSGIFWNADAKMAMLYWWQKELWQWDQDHWRTLDKETFKSKMYEFLDGARRDLRGYQVSFDPNKRIVGDVIDALKGVVNLEPDRLMPGWLGKEPPVENVRELVAMKNGLLYLPTRKLLTHTPEVLEPECVGVRF